MPLFVKKYLSATVGLDNSEHGAYMLSLMKYWVKGGALTTEELKEACGREFDQVKRFFVFDSGLWNNEQSDKQLKLAWAREKSAREKAMKGVEARRRNGSLPPK